MAMKYNYDRYNSILAYIQEPKQVADIAEYMKMDKKNVRNHLNRLIIDKHAIIVNAAKRQLTYQALVKSIGKNDLSKAYVPNEPKEKKERVAKIKVEPKYEWSPNMIVRPNDCQRLQRLHSETARMRTLELQRKRNDVYVGSYFSMMGAL